MDIGKITEGQFDKIKGSLSINDFKTLDVNGDGYLSNEDVNATDNAEVKSALQNILNQSDEDAGLDLDAEFNETPEATKPNTTDSVVDSNIQATIAEATEQQKAAATIAGINIPGYEVIDATNLTVKTKEELQTMLGKIRNNIALLNAEIEKLEEENARYNAEISSLQAQNAQIEQEKKALETQVSGKQTVLSEKQEKIAEEEHELETYTNEFVLIQQELDEANRRIQREQNKAEQEYREDIQRTTDRAIQEYDPERDGTFESFFLRKLSSAGLTMFADLSSLNDEAVTISDQAKQILERIHVQAEVVYYARLDATSIENEVKGIQDQIKAKDDLINANNSRITTLRGNIATNDSKISALNDEIAKNNRTRITVEKALEEKDYNGKDILALISPAEKKLILDNKIDITKGYFIAQAKDGNWHVYDSGGTSVARKYGKKGSGLRGSDIIPSGSGYVNNKKQNCNGKPVYTFSTVNADLTDGKQTHDNYTYSTSSPLSFDVNGDGVNTSSQTMMYDIDGNGSLDKINNSDDWVLAFDKDGNGIAGENGSELFGDNTDLNNDGVKDGYKNGFEALKALASQEGLIGENDSVLDQKDLNTLSQKFGLTMTRGYGGEAKSFNDLGITQINIAQTNETTLHKNFDGRNNDLMTQEGATFVVNGQTREYADIWNAKFNPVDESQKPTLQINEQNVLAIKGFVDGDAIKDEFRKSAPNSMFLRNKIENWEKEKAKEEEKAAKAEEAKKQEEIKAEEAKKEEEKIAKEKEDKKKEEAKKANKEQ